MFYFSKNKESPKNQIKSSSTKISEELFPTSDDDNIQQQQDQEALEQQNEIPKDSIDEDRNKLSANNEVRNESTATNNEVSDESTATNDEAEARKLPGSEPAGIRSQRRRSTEVIKLMNRLDFVKIICVKWKNLLKLSSLYICALYNTYQTKFGTMWFKLNSF